MRFTLVQAGLEASHRLRRCPHVPGFGSRKRLGISHCWAKASRRYWAGNSHPVWFGWCPLTACAQARVVVWVTCQEVGSWQSYASLACSSLEAHDLAGKS